MFNAFMITLREGIEAWRGDACTVTIPPSVFGDFSANALVDPPGVRGSSEVKAASVMPGVTASRSRI